MLEQGLRLVAGSTMVFAILGLVEFIDGTKMRHLFDLGWAYRFPSENYSPKWRRLDNRGLKVVGYRLLMWAALLGMLIGAIMALIALLDRAIGS
ncbi:hypothetical protein [Nocardioides sp. REDSEA-S30_B4]|jgi:hypothetical protein|uniref:hypothetical protein n=1 Tax=Nocardioides sp. REDSEA-S30_B4 TaxID=1811552 RepID=UPI000ACB59B4|nr:hypothetical protein [Nocardioides sp. REDSEA-S30_B4]